MASACDVDDGVDGTIRLIGLPVGQVILVESSVPTGYLSADNTAVEVLADATTTVEVADRCQGRRITQDRQARMRTVNRCQVPASTSTPTPLAASFDGRAMTRRTRERRHDPLLRPCRERLSARRIRPALRLPSRRRPDRSCNGRGDDHPDHRRPGRWPDRGQQARRGRRTASGILLRRRPGPEQPRWNPRRRAPATGSTTVTTRNNGVIAVIGLVTGDYFLVETFAP